MSERETNEKLKAEIGNREGEKLEMREVIDRLKADLEREREVNAKLREALKGAREALGPSPWGSLRHEIDALLAAKQDDCSRCKHGIHGKDCYRCYPSDAKQDEEGKK